MKDEQLDGARKERQAIMAKIRRMLKEGSDLADLEHWVHGRHKRYEAKPGGLGRKKKGSTRRRLWTGAMMAKGPC